ncbi:hypothetical protein HYALB_00007582 [Hymenoscyphus albidus]|uniref:Uncharacterized protein n=1 Tax=Hymenoscyphus albidus TaxID=595503 RepID=A0A9N9LH96_9HELO|nr:hypothetical protein HYALB_00007582 [Hymenoscyphus albidus]
MTSIQRPSTSKYHYNTFDPSEDSTTALRTCPSKPSNPTRGIETLHIILRCAVIIMRFGPVVQSTLERFGQINVDWQEELEPYAHGERDRAYTNVPREVLNAIDAQGEHIIRLMEDEAGENVLMAVQAGSGSGA